MTRHTTIATWFFALAILPGSARCASGLPEQWLGEWEVAQSALDTADQPHWRYEPNDPRLLGRILKLGNHGAISFNFANEACDRVSWTVRAETSLSALVGTTFPRPPRPGLAKAPRLKDFGAGLEERSVVPYIAVCSTAERTTTDGKPPRWGSAWFVAIDPMTLLMAYDGDSLLVLRKLARDGVGKASFSCKGNLAPPESAICSSASLAGYDRSVALAYRRALKRRSDDKGTIQEEQRAWLAQRNTCQSDSACLEDRMRERVDALMQID